jgi:hypothetical protein
LPELFGEVEFEVALVKDLRSKTVLGRRRSLSLFLSMNLIVGGLGKKHLIA